LGKNQNLASPKHSISYGCVWSYKPTAIPSNILSV